jgi:hypothetical protein
MGERRQQSSFPFVQSFNFICTDASQSGLFSSQGSFRKSCFGGATGNVSLRYFIVGNYRVSSEPSKDVCCFFKCARHWYVMHVFVWSLVQRQVFEGCEARGRSDGNCMKGNCVWRFEFFEFSMHAKHFKEEFLHEKSFEAQRTFGYLTLRFVADRTAILLCVVVVVDSFLYSRTVRRQHRDICNSEPTKSKNKTRLEFHRKFSKSFWVFPRLPPHFTSINLHLPSPILEKGHQKGPKVEESSI